MSDFPLTPGEAIVLATFLEDHAKLPHLVALVDRLRTWARQQPQTEHEEGEMPSQSTDSGLKRGTLDPSPNEATLGGTSERSRTEGLTATPSLTESGGIGL